MADVVRRSTRPLTPLKRLLRTLCASQNPGAQEDLEAVGPTAGGFVGNARHVPGPVLAHAEAVAASRVDLQVRRHVGVRV